MAKPRKSYAWWITTLILRFLFALLIFGVCAFVVWRAFISNIAPSGMEELHPNAPLTEAFAQKGESLVIFRQEEGTMTRGEHNYGYFGVSYCVFIPEAQQVQLVVRYNNSTLAAIARDKGLAEEPPKGERILDVTLLKMIDLTPEDLTDNKDGSATVGRERIQPTGEPVIDTTLLYTYCHYTFDGVVTEGDTLAVFADIYYEGDVNYDADPYGTLRIYHTQNQKLYQKLSGDEIDALKQYGK